MIELSRSTQKSAFLLISFSNFLRLYNNSSDNIETFYHQLHVALTLFMFSATNLDMIEQDFLLRKRQISQSIQWSASQATVVATNGRRGYLSVQSTTLPFQPSWPRSNFWSLLAIVMRQESYNEYQTNSIFNQHHVQNIVGLIQGFADDTKMPSSVKSYESAIQALFGLMSILNCYKPFQDLYHCYNWWIYERTVRGQ